jgi:DHA2 family multidrug resistance protein-like MFS transporter
MTDATLLIRTSRRGYDGTDRFILGIVLAVTTFWFFAQTTLNVAPSMAADLRISDSVGIFRQGDVH